MARSSLFRGLRRRGAVLCAVFAYALLLNALLAAVFDVQAIAAALDPLSNAASCDSSGSSEDPIRHNRQHQPDCTLCGSACAMGGSIQGLEGVGAVIVTPPASFGLAAGALRVFGINPPSVYRSDTAAQAPPAIG